MKIETGTPEDHPSLLSSSHPALAGQTPVFAAEESRSGTQGGVRDATGERLAQLDASEADIAAAQSAGMSAENDRRGGYHEDILPHGAMYGDQPDLPVVPEDATSAANGFLYPQGDQPGV